MKHLFDPVLKPRERILWYSKSNRSWMSIKSLPIFGGLFVTVLMLFVFLNKGFDFIVFIFILGGVFSYGIQYFKEIKEVIENRNKLIALTESRIIIRTGNNKFKEFELSRVMIKSFEFEDGGKGTILLSDVTGPEFDELEHYFDLTNVEDVGLAYEILLERSHLGTK